MGLAAIPYQGAHVCPKGRWICYSLHLVEAQARWLQQVRRWRLRSFLSGTLGHAVGGWSPQRAESEVGSAHSLSLEQTRFAIPSELCAREMLPCGCIFLCAAPPFGMRIRRVYSGTYGRPSDKALCVSRERE